MPRVKRKATLRKKQEAKKYHKRARRATRKGKGYEHECLFPTPETRGDNEKDSCSLINLNDTYGTKELGIEGKNQCNMYYYVDNENYYRCRNSNKSGTRCNKRGAYGSGKVKCSIDSVNRIKDENIELEGELQDLINPYARYPSVPVTSSSFSTVPSHPSSIPTHSHTIRSNDVRSTLKRTYQSRASPQRTSLAPSCLLYTSDAADE